jgi:hypothetical protein
MQDNWKKNYDQSQPPQRQPQQSPQQQQRQLWHALISAHTLGTLWAYFDPMMGQFVSSWDADRNTSQEQTRMTGTGTDHDAHHTPVSHTRIC